MTSVSDGGKVAKKVYKREIKQRSTASVYQKVTMTKEMKERQIRQKILEEERNREDQRQMRAHFDKRRIYEREKKEDE